jgi:hypothetical protein
MAGQELRSELCFVRCSFFWHIHDLVSFAIGLVLYRVWILLRSLPRWISHDITCPNTYLYTLISLQSRSYNFSPSINFLASSTPSSTFSAFVPCPIAVCAPGFPPALPPTTGVTAAAHLGPSAPAALCCCYSVSSSFSRSQTKREKIFLFEKRKEKGNIPLRRNIHAQPSLPLHSH